MAILLLDVALLLGGSGAYLLTDDPDWQRIWLRMSERAAADSAHDVLRLIRERNAA